jgi:hypothetical protein
MNAGPSPCRILSIGQFAGRSVNQGEQACYQEYRSRYPLPDRFAVNGPQAALDSRQSRPSGAAQPLRGPPYLML